MGRWILFALLVPILSGCASVLSDRVLDSTSSVSFSTARDFPEKTTGKLVVVGGLLLGIHEQNGQSYLEILEFPLDSRLRPIEGDDSEGRFLVLMAGRPDPGVWAQDRLVTLAGKMEGVEFRELGQTSYRYPVFSLEEVHLWPEDRGYYSRPVWGWSIGGGFSF